MVRHSKNRTLLKSLILSLFIVTLAVVALVVNPKLLTLNMETRSKAAVGDKKPITGSFILPDFYTPPPNELTGMITEMKNIGIDTLIFQRSGLLKSACTTPKTYTEEFELATGRVMSDILKIAKQQKMKIIIGLVHADDCIKFWEGDPNDPNSYPGKIIDYSVRLIPQIRTALTQNGWTWDDPDFLGLYIPQEGGFFNDTAAFDTLNYAFFKTISEKIKNLAPTKKIVISPWVFEEINYAPMKEEAVRIFRDTRVDIIAQQDSMGSRSVTSLEKDKQHFQALSDAVTVYPGKEVWANIESFTTFPDKPGQMFPTTFLKLDSQIITAKPYVSKMITYIYQTSMLINPYFDTIPMSSYTPDRAIMRKNLYNAYKQKYVDIVVTTTPSDCSVLQVCNITDYTCKATSAQYSASSHKQCGGSGATCETNLQLYQTGKTTGNCHNNLTACQTACKKPATPTPTRISTPAPTLQTCEPRYFCNITTSTCQATSSTYDQFTDIQCGGTNTCATNLSLYWTGKTTGVCYKPTDRASCQTICNKPTFTPTPTETPAPQPIGCCTQKIPYNATSCTQSACRNGAQTTTKISCYDYSNCCNFRQYLPGGSTNCP